MKVVIVLFVALTLIGFEPLAIGQESPDSDYVSTDLEFKTHDKHAMLGRLVLPKSKSPRAIVVSVQTAEGMTIDMKRPLGKAKTFNYFDVYRDKLTAMNIGHFSYEGRGIRMGEEPPRYEKIDWDVYNTSTLDNKAKDVISAIERIRKQDGLAKTPIFLLGASEGTLVAAETASRRPEEVKGLVLYGVLATNLRETFHSIMTEGSFLKHRPMDTNKDGSVSPEEWEVAVKKAGKGAPFSQADKNEDGKFSPADYQILNKKYVDAIDGNDFEVLQAWAEKNGGMAVPKGWFKDHFDHADNWTFLSKLDIPDGCFQGDMDAMTLIGPVKDLEAKAKMAGLAKMEFHYIDGGDHTLKIGDYFATGQLPKGHKAIFKFIDRIAPGPKGDSK